MTDMTPPTRLQGVTLAERLLPCPGCGQEATRVIGGPGTRAGPSYWAGCDFCRWRTWGNTEQEAISAWNTREAAAALSGEVDATFAEWLASEMPAGTVIGNPAWWANRIARQYAVRATPQAPQPVVDGDVARALEWFHAVVQESEDSADKPYIATIERALAAYSANTGGVQQGVVDEGDATAEHADWSQAKRGALNTTTGQQAVTDAWRDLVRRAWLTLTIECPNDPLNDELATAIAAQGEAGEG